MLKLTLALSSLKESFKNPFVHYLVKIIKTNQFVLADFETDSIHFELFCSCVIIQTCMHLLGSGNVGTSAVFLVSKVLKHPSLSPGFISFITRYKKKQELLILLPNFILIIITRSKLKQYKIGLFHTTRHMFI